MQENLLSTAGVDTTTTGAVGPYATIRAAYQSMPAFPSTSLAGRTLTVGATEEITLEPGEVILTFDDGPRPGTTPAILDTLDRFGVKRSEERRVGKECRDLASPAKLTDHLT